MMDGLGVLCPETRLSTVSDDVVSEEYLRTAYLDLQGTTTQMLLFSIVICLFGPQISVRSRLLPTQ